MTPALGEWGSSMHELVESMPESVVKCAVFDIAEHPAEGYARIRVCLAGDVTRTSSPFYRAGVSMAVGDALILVSVLEMALTKTNRPSKAEAVLTTLQAYGVVYLARALAVAGAKLCVRWATFPSGNIRL